MSGLSWLTILRKRENFRRAFRDFEPAAVARFSTRDVTRLMNDGGIVRNRAKIEATINNARRHAELVKEFGSFPAYVWRYEAKPRRRLLDQAGLYEIGSASAEATAMSKDLRRRGWGFVGPTTVYSFMQAMGLVNDHLRGCAAGAEAQRLRRDFARPQ
jgi:DNA-3-methyladenine glycosylase I